MGRYWKYLYWDVPNFKKPDQTSKIINKIENQQKIMDSKKKTKIAANKKLPRVIKLPWILVSSYFSAPSVLQTTWEKKEIANMDIETRWME